MECESFGQVICKCGSMASAHVWVEVAQMLGGCSECSECVVWIPGVFPDIDKAQGAHPDASTVESSDRGEGHDHVVTVGEERRQSQSAQPGSLFIESRPWKPSPVKRFF